MLCIDTVRLITSSKLLLTNKFSLKSYHEKNGYYPFLLSDQSASLHIYSPLMLNFLNILESSIDTDSTTLLKMLIVALSFGGQITDHS